MRTKGEQNQRANFNYIYGKIGSKLTSTSKNGTSATCEDKENAVNRMFGQPTTRGDNGVEEYTSPMDLNPLAEEYFSGFRGVNRRILNSSSNLSINYLTLSSLTSSVRDEVVEVVG